MAIFRFNDISLHDLAEQTLAIAKENGATATAININENIGQTVSVRLDALETIAYNRDASLSVTTYMGQRSGSASTSDLSVQSIRDTVKAAIAIAHYTAEDPYAGLADSALFAQRFFDLKTYCPTELSVEKATEMARLMENTGMSVDPRIENSSGASVSSQAAQSIYANSSGFYGIDKETYYSASVALIAKEAENLQQDYWFDAARALTGLQNMKEIGAKAGERAVGRLHARRIKTTQVPVLFDPTVAGSLINHWIAAVSGSNLYRRSSFLLDSLENQVFSPIVEIKELPHIVGGFGSCIFDAEGVATKDRDIVTNGILHGYFLGSYSARKLNLETTANAGGAHNLDIKATHKDLAALAKEMHTGLLVTELMGHGVNLVTGDYSRGASGFWVENGEIQYPVEEITIAGNLKTMFKEIVGIGADRLPYSSLQCGAILLSNMMVAGE